MAADESAVDLAVPGHGLPDPILQPYLLVLFSLPFYVDGDGRRWINALWAKDLVEHARYIKRLTLAAPAVRGPAPSDCVAMDDIPALRSVRCVELPFSQTWSRALASLPEVLSTLWAELKQAKVVHSAVAAWPIPEAWLLVPLLWLRPRPLYLNVESAFWRVVPGNAATLSKRIKAYFVERVHRFCLGRSDLSTFTHEGYRRSLLPGRATAHVVEASWIDEHLLIAREDLAPTLLRRREDGVLRMVFVGRLAPEKGILVLVEAMALSAKAGVRVSLDVVGGGPLRQACIDCVAQHGLGDVVSFLGQIPYDGDFFKRLRTYRLLIVPSLSDEQPRVVLDAYSQAVPVLASRTEGLLQCVEDGVTGRLFEAGNAQDLHGHIASFAADPDVLDRMASDCVEFARRLTHKSIHEARWRLLVSAFPALTRA